MQIFTSFFFNNDILNTMITDYIMIGVLLYFFFNGWRKGFFRALLGPISLIIGCLIAFIYYQRTQNLAISLFICALSPFVLKILFSLILKLWNKATNKGAPPSISSKLLGSTFSVLWGGSYLAILVILIGLIPVHPAWFEKIQNDVIVSKSYHAIYHFIENKVPAASGNIKKLAAIFENPAKLQQFQSTKEFETLMEDDNLKEIFSDEETAEQIRNKEYGKLMANPKIQSVFQNEQLLKKMFALNKKIMEASLDDELSNMATESHPKVIEAE